jgi:DnaK suppressor protein
MPGKKPAAKSAAAKHPKLNKLKKPAASHAATHKAAKPVVKKPLVKRAAKAVPAKPVVKSTAKPIERPALKPAAKPAAPALKSAAPAAAPVQAAVASAPLAAAPAPPSRPIRIPGPVAIGVVTGASQQRLAAESGEGEDVDNEGASLLAGPRNVTPYIAKRGEQYMNQEQLGHFRLILETWKRDLMVEVDRTVSHMKDEAANFPDPNDRATQEEEFSLELRTRDRERKLIRKIDSALQRIEDGSYGYCLETGEEIGIKRLEARPVATLSLEAQERRERREKQYGDRDDRYR